MTESTPIESATTSRRSSSPSSRPSSVTINVQVEAYAGSDFSPTLIEDTLKETLFNPSRTDEHLKVE